jgi:hypothetical protein
LKIHCKDQGFDASKLNVVFNVKEFAKELCMAVSLKTPEKVV